MDVDPANILFAEREWSAARSYVAFFEHEYARVMRDKNPDADIKLALLNQKGVFYVLLNDKAV